MVDAGEPGVFERIGTEGAILPDNLSGICTASSWPLWKEDFASEVLIEPVEISRSSIWIAKSRPR